MKTEIFNRKGARKAIDIPQEVMELLNDGSIETVNLTEWLAIDHTHLVQAVFPTIGIPAEFIQSLIEKLQSQKKPSTMNSTKLIGTTLYEYYSKEKTWSKVFDHLRRHVSDSIRCYSPYLIGLQTELSIEQKLEHCKSLAADHHFGVREVTWMALRPSIEEHLLESIEYLSKWTVSEDENVRRFTTEATRPRGVWCKHIERLKESPELALSILENLRSDDSKYVQDSVGNWLNDASKSRPDFVIELCNRWKTESPTKETNRIIKRARRTIDK